MITIPGFIYTQVCSKMETDRPKLQYLKQSKFLYPHVDAILLCLSPVLRLHPRLCLCPSNLV